MESAKGRLSHKINPHGIHGGSAIPAQQKGGNMRPSLAQRGPDTRPAYAACLIFVKIIRPALVCSTVVTTTSTVSPMWRLPLSTTIIVPSSR